MPRVNPDFRHEAPDDRVRNRHMHLPLPPRHQGRNGYHSDNETAFDAKAPRVSQARRVPSPPPVDIDPPSMARRVPSPPPVIDIHIPTPYGSRARRHHHIRSTEARVPSPPRVSRPRRVSLPPRQRDRRRNSHSHSPRPPVDTRRRSSDEHDLPRPRTPPSPYPKVYNPYLSPPDGLDYSSSGGDRPQGLKRWKSERIPKHSRQTSSVKSTTSVVLSDSTLRSSLPQSPGALGDQAYQYRPLQDSEFRLVRIFPERRTMIKCEIVHASLEVPRRYIAISYAWGDAGDTRKIELEGSLIPIGVSLYGALEALRQKVESVLVWVDKLCIDQTNRDERTQQVQLMTRIYSTAESVAIWLGPEEDDSTLAIDLLSTMADQAGFPKRVSRLISSQVGKRDLAAVVSLFERDYWRRLWVVQEIYNARSIMVYCGSSKLPWSVYQIASRLFNQHRDDLDYLFPGSRRDRRQTISLNQYSYSQVLVYQGPNSLPELRSYMGLGNAALLQVLRACRRKLASDPRDKLFGILGVLPEEPREEFHANYSLSVKDVYTEIVDYLLKTTERLDVICDAIHFPVHTGSANLPSYVPDWSHIPQVSAMGHKYSFSAAGETKAKCKFLDDRLNKLEISAIYLDTISFHGIAVGTLTTLGDYLMAFLHWRAVLLGSLEDENDEEGLQVQQDFCMALSLGQIPPPYSFSQWLTVCYHVFASLLRERLPHLPLDRKLRDYVDAKIDIKPEARREFLQKHFGDQMMGRCFCRTNEGRIGMGSGLMLPGDIVVIPLGCSTPVLLRLEGTRGEYRFVGDIYINGYMHGRAADQLKDGKRELSKYVLH